MGTHSSPRRWTALSAGAAAVSVAAVAVLCVTLGSLPAFAGDLEAIRQRGRLRVAVYNDFMPYSKAGKGIDVELAPRKRFHPELKING